MRYLLDTNVISDLVRNPQGRVAQRIRGVGEAQVCTSIIVAAELRYGAARAIGGNDLLIAAQVIALGYALVTDNEREFAQIDSLAQENWLHQAQ